MRPSFETVYEKNTFQMSYPKQEGYIPPYSGPALVSGDSSFPPNLSDSISRGHKAGIEHYLQATPSEVNLPGFNGQRPIHTACYRGDDGLVKVSIKCSKSH